MSRGVEDMDTKSCVIEFQAFRDNNDKYIIKELAILDLLTFVVYPFMFEAPFSFSKLNAKSKTTNKWITKHFHRIQWYEGFISYTNLHSIMFQFCKQYPHIYTRGLEKKNWIQRYTHGKVYDIKVNKDFKHNIDNICTFAKDSKHAQSQCSLRNAYILAAYLEETQKFGGGGLGGGGSERYKYGGVTRPQHEYSTRLRRGNISEDTTTDEDGITTISPNTSGSVQHSFKIEYSTN